MEKGLQAGNEYTKIVVAYVNKIISLESQIVELKKKLPKKQQVFYFTFPVTEPNI